jgi:hypothetical protein
MVEHRILWIPKEAEEDSDLALRHSDDYNRNIWCCVAQGAKRLAVKRRRLLDKRQLPSKRNQGTSLVGLHEAQQLIT